MVFAWLVNIFSARAQKTIYDAYPVYKGNDLGLTYSSKNKVFKQRRAAGSGLQRILVVVDRGSLVCG